MTTQEPLMSDPATNDTNNGQEIAAPDFAATAALEIDRLRYGHSRTDMVDLIAGLMELAWERGFRSGQSDILHIEQERANELFATVLVAGFAS